jgi:pimeloyl-ACP methyl ester carboxylesterase
MQSIEVDGIPASYVDRGRGIPVLCIHGFPLDHSMWRGQYESAIPGVRWIAPDLPGFGASQFRPDIVTMADYADWLVKFMRHLEVREPFVICGLSMGGYIAWEILRRHMPEVLAAVLADTRAAADTPEVARGRELMAQQVLEEGKSVVIDSILPRLFSESTQESQHHLVDQTRGVIESASREGIAAALCGMAQRRDMTAELGGLQLPILLICGEFDVITPLSGMQQIADALLNGKLVGIPEAGHMSPLENPQAVNAAMQEFL